MSNQWQYLFFIPLFGVNQPIELASVVESPKIFEQVRGDQLVKSEGKTSYCSLELEPLTDILFQDLPNYGNRVIQRTQNMNREAGISTYIVTAGRGQFEALALPQIQYNSATKELAQQVFFTTLERQYITSNSATQSPKTLKREREIYHWLFLTPTEHGWYMAAMYSKFGSSQENSLTTPPQESTNGIVGQAIQLWLKDCRAGKTLVDG